MALIVATSALLGGITVALWNRKILEGMRRTGFVAPPENRSPRDEPDEFI